MSPNFYIQITKSKTSVILILLLWSAMGPYINPRLGLRVEHVLMYGLLVFFAIKTQFGVFLPNDRAVRTLFVLFVSLFLVTILVTLVSDYSPSFRKVMADSENYLQPIVLILLTYQCIKKFQVNELISTLDIVTRTIIIILSINALLAVSSIFFGSWVLDYFNVGGEYEGSYRSVAAGASKQGRYTGIFNQPFEAGVAYGACLLLIVTLKLLRGKQLFVKTSNMFLNAGILLMFAGGLLSVSKVFFPLSIVVAIFFLLLNNKRFLNILFSGRSFLSTVWFAIAGLVFIVYFFNYWSGLDYLLRLVNFIGTDVDVVELFTAGRFSLSASGESVVGAKLSDANLIVGYGLGSIQAPDNAYLEILYFSGVLGLLIYFFILFALVVFSIRCFRVHPVVARYLLSLTIFIALASIGAPVFGINRSNFFIIIPLVISIRILTLAKNNQILAKPLKSSSYPQLAQGTKT